MTFPRYILTLILLLSSVFCFAQTVPGLRRVQVGAYQNLAHAEEAFYNLRKAGLNPMYEYHNNYRRVVLPGISAQNLSSITTTLQNAGFRNVWSRLESDKQYWIHVGSYRETANAQRAFNALKNAGLNPEYEDNRGLQRVVLNNINIRNLYSTLGAVYGAGFFQVWVSENRGQISAEQVPSQVTIVVRGNAVVDTIQNTGSTEPLVIVQTIPSFVYTDSNRAYNANAPIVFFFNDKIYRHSIADNVYVTADRIPVDGTILIDEGNNGFAVLTFTPDDPLPAGKEIVVVMNQGLQNASGNQMLNDVSISFTTERGSDTDFSGNYGFEQGIKGVVFAGDGIISTARGPLAPYEGNLYAAISTGTCIVSDHGVAIGNRSSQIQIGPILESFSSVSFYYNFISSEFNEFVGSEFDDTAMVTVYGPKGTYTEIITSVNIIGFDNKPFIGYPGIPDEGYTSYAGQTGWLNYTIDKIDVGTPAFIVFTVTDVGDDYYSSILAIDAIELK